VNELILEIKGVSKAFGPQIVLDDVSLSVKRSEVIAIIGPSGVGKSVLIKIIMGMLPYKGRVLWKGQEVGGSGFNYRAYRKNFGMLFQHAALLDDLNNLDNILFPVAMGSGKKRLGRQGSVLRVNDSDFSEAQDLAEALDLGDVLYKYPGEVSLGTKKRVGLARALICRPEFVLFDEPNSGLDPLDGQAVYDLINKLRKIRSFTGLVISHEIPEVLQVVDRVNMLWQGRFILNRATEEEIKESQLQPVRDFFEFDR